MARSIFPLVVAAQQLLRTYATIAAHLFCLGAGMSTTIIMEPDVQQKLAILGGEASDVDQQDGLSRTAIPALAGCVSRRRSELGKLDHLF
jgi:hypothetical protein